MSEENSYSDKLAKMTPSYIIGFFSFIEGILSSILIYYAPNNETQKEFFLHISIICIIIVIIAVFLLIYKYEIYRKNDASSSRILAIAITTTIYIGLTLSRVFGIITINPLFQFFIAIWVILIPQFVGNKQYVSFKIIDQAGKEKIHSCDPNSLDYKRDDGKNPKLLKYHTIVYFKYRAVIDRFLNAKIYNYDQQNNRIYYPNQNPRKKDKWSIKIHQVDNKDIIWVFLGDLGKIYYDGQSIFVLEIL